MYSTGKIYKVCADGFDKVYVGSTRNTLKTRLNYHKDNHKSISQNKTACCVLFEDDRKPYIELIENYPCASKKELEARERYWLEQTPNAVNKNIPTQTWQERHEKNKEHNAKMHKAWQEANKEQESLKQKNRRLALTEEERKQKDKNDYEKTKEVRSARKKERVICPECQCEFSRHSLTKHRNNAHITKVIT